MQSLRRLAWNDTKFIDLITLTGKDVSVFFVVRLAKPEVSAYLFQGIRFLQRFEPAFLPSHAPTELNRQGPGLANSQAVLIVTAKPAVNFSRTAAI
jgi:hypothetical protein